MTPMRADDVRRFALSLPETVEGEHGHRPAFRVSKRLFAVIQPGADDLGAVVQEWITVHLANADPTQLEELLEDAWRRLAPKRAIASYERSSSPTS